MKHYLILAAAMLATLISCNTSTGNVETIDSTLDEIELLSPEKTGRGTAMEAFWNRRTDREYGETEISLVDMSNLLWAACGINRPDSGRRTNPTAVNLQEISIYVFLKGGVYLYDHNAHALHRVADGDHRDIVTAGQDFAKDAPASLVIVMDMGKYGDDGHGAQLLAAIDAGIVSQNINLFCAASGMATATRATMDKAGIAELLGLTGKQIPILNNPVGYRR